jgi:hypothetical protein
VVLLDHTAQRRGEEWGSAALLVILSQQQHIALTAESVSESRNSSLFSSSLFAQDKTKTKTKISAPFSSCIRKNRHLCLWPSQMSSRPFLDENTYPRDRTSQYLKLLAHSYDFSRFDLLTLFLEWVLFTFWFLILFAKLSELIHWRWIFVFIPFFATLFLGLLRGFLCGKRSRCALCTRIVVDACISVFVTLLVLQLDQQFPPLWHAIFAPLYCLSGAFHTILTLHRRGKRRKRRRHTPPPPTHHSLPTLLTHHTWTDSLGLFFLVLCGVFMLSLVRVSGDKLLKLGLFTFCVDALSISLFLPLVACKISKSPPSIQQWYLSSLSFFQIICTMCVCFLIWLFANNIQVLVVYLHSSLVPSHSQSN